MTARDTTLVGALLDHRYLVTGLLARGGMSTVYRGVDTRLERPVAIKVMHQQYAADRSWAQRFEREARAAAKLHHPNVVAVHDQGVDYTGDQANAFLVMELVDGGTLRDLLEERGALPPELAVSVTAPLLAALAAAHRAGLVHRDVKPENVLIGHGAGTRGESDAGSVKVADFGLVRAIASAGTTSSSVILGTVAYLSPEQVETGFATERSDVYSSGLLLYEMLTGKPAFSGDTALSVAYQHVNSDVPPPSATNPDVPAALDELVLRATRREPAERPADAGAFLTELEKVRAELGLERVPVPAQPAPDADTVAVDATLPAMAAVGAEPRSRTSRSTRPSGMAVTAHDPFDEPPPRRSALRVAFWALVALLAGGLAAFGVWIFLQAGDVKVPKVGGMDQARAEQVLGTAELEAKIVKKRHNTVEAGKAIGTDPKAGTELRTGDSVTLLISLGKPTVPDIAQGTTRADAESAIKKVQLEPAHDEKSDAYHATVPEGAVISVSPGPGTQLRIGETVHLVLSKGPPPTPVPSVKGLDRDAAFERLREAGFEPYDAGKEFDAEIDNGKVVRTDPAEGATLEGDAPRVGVYLSNAVEVPRVTFMRLEQAMRILGNQGLKGEVTEGNPDGLVAFVVAQDPAEGSRVKPNSTVKLRVFG